MLCRHAELTLQKCVFLSLVTNIRLKQSQVTRFNNWDWLYGNRFLETWYSSIMYRQLICSDVLERHSSMTDEQLGSMIFGNLISKYHLDSINFPRYMVEMEVDHRRTACQPCHTFTQPSDSAVRWSSPQSASNVRHSKIKTIRIFWSFGECMGHLYGNKRRLYVKYRKVPIPTQLCGRSTRNRPGQVVHLTSPEENISWLILSATFDVLYIDYNLYNLFRIHSRITSSTLSTRVNSNKRLFSIVDPHSTCLQYNAYNDIVNTIPKRIEKSWACASTTYDSCDWSAKKHLNIFPKNILKPICQ